MRVFITKRKNIVSLIVFLCGFLMVFLISCTTSPGTGTLSPLHVNGNRLVCNGTPVVLKGVSIADPYKLDTEDNHFSEDIFKELSQWNINVVRVPIHPGWWQAEENYPEKYLDVVVKWAKKYNVYLILDWHAIGDPLTGQPQSPEWTTGGYAVYDSSFELAEKAWMELAERYGNLPYVIFELFNEPAALGGNAPSWKEWQQKLTGLIDNIRTKAKDTLILVSGWRWTYDLSGFKDYPIKRDNIAYVAHVYPNNTGWFESFGFLSYKYPVIITEWGYSPDADQTIHYYGTRESFGIPFLKFMNKWRLSWVSWCFHPAWGPNMVKDWNFTLNDQGTFVKQILLPDKKKPEITIKNPAHNSSVSGLITIEGEVTDNTGIFSVDVEIVDTLVLPASIKFSEDFLSGNWSYTWNSRRSENKMYTININGKDFKGNIAGSSVTIQLENPVDNVPPSATIETPLENTVVQGNMVIKGTVSDDVELENFRIAIDKNERAAFNFNDPEKSSIFSLFSFDNNSFSINVDTYKINGGNHTVDLIATDIFGNTTSTSVNMHVENTDILTDCEETFNWNFYYGGGSSLEIGNDDGVDKKGIKAVYAGSPTGWWGIAFNTFKDFSHYSGIEFYMKGTENIVRIQLHDSENKLWGYDLSPKGDWQKISIPFTDFGLRGDFQFPEAARNQNLAHDIIWSVQFIHSTKQQSATGILWIDNIQLY